MQLGARLNIVWHCLSLRLEWKQTFSSTLATAAFSKCAGILSEALSQHHLLGFEIVVSLAMSFFQKLYLASFPPITIWLPDVKSWFIGKDPDSWKDCRQEKATTEDEMVGWHYRLSRHVFEQASRDVKDKEPWHAAVYVVTTGQDWGTEQQQETIV